MIDKQPVGAESALAAAHPRPGVKLDPVQRGMPLPDGLDHFRLRNALAPADDVGVGRFPPGELVQFRVSSAR